MAGTVHVLARMGQRLRRILKAGVRSGTLCVFLVCCTASQAQAACRLALVLALDVSGSVDQREYRLQLDGLANALHDPDVATAIFALPSAPISIAVFEWSSSGYQRLIQDWVALETDADLNALTQRLRSWTREAAPQATGLGAAMQFSQGMLERGPECWKQTLDISADGKNNDWPTPLDLKRKGTLGPFRINGLVIAEGDDGSDTSAAELSAYFRARVIQGPDAFVEVALGFSDYERAMRRKLLKELQTQPMGLSDPFPRRVARQ